MTERGIEDITWLDRVAKDEALWASPEVVTDIATMMLDEPVLYQRIVSEMRGTPGIDRSYVNRLVKAKARELESKRKRLSMPQLKDDSIPSFTIGSETEVKSELLHHIDTEDEPATFDEDRFWRYSGIVKAWAPLEKETLSVKIQEWDGALVFQPDSDKPKILRVSSTFKNGAINLLQDHLKARDIHQALLEGQSGRGFFARADAGLAFANITIKRDSIHGIAQFQPGPEHRVRHVYPFDYDKNATCPKWIAYLNSVWQGAEHDDVPERILFVQEFFGAAMLGLATRIGKKAIYAYDHGNGGSGKSQFLAVLEAMFPKEWTCSVPPQDMSDNVQGASLAGKRLNLVYESPDRPIVHDDGFKDIVHGEAIQRTRKYGHPFRFEPEAAHVFAANRLPQAPRVTNAFWDRWVILHFHNRFRDTEHEIKDISGKILATERQGIITWAIEGAKRLIEQGHYTIPESSYINLGKWKVSARPVDQFKADLLSPLRATGEVVPKAEMFQKYCEWAKANGYSPLNIQNFKVALEDAGVEYGRGTGGKRGWKTRFLEAYEREKDNSMEDVPF